MPTTSASSRPAARHDSKKRATCLLHVPYRVARVMRAHGVHMPYHVGAVSSSGKTRPARSTAAIGSARNMRCRFLSTHLQRSGECLNGATRHILLTPSNRRAPSGRGTGRVVQAYMWGDGAEGAARRQPAAPCRIRSSGGLPALLALSVGPTVAFGHHLIGCGNCAAAALPKGTASTPAAAKEARGAAMRGDARVWG